MRGELLERDHGLRPLDSSQLREVLNHDVREIVVLPHADNRNKVPIARDGVDLGHAFNVGQLRAEVTKAFP